MKTNRPKYAEIDATPAGIPKDEPVFLLRAQDACASAAVRFYADQVEARRGDPQVIASARALAVEMDAWPKKKEPDFPQDPVLAGPDLGKFEVDPAELAAAAPPLAKAPKAKP